MNAVRGFFARLAIAPGGATSLRESCRDRREFPFLRSLLQDIRCAVGVVLGVSAGYLPVERASRIEPVKVRKYE